MLWRGERKRVTAVRIRRAANAVPVIGHRGASGHCPENTIPAFARALELGAAWVETDVKRTGDGHFVLMHDRTIDRTTDGTGAVCDLSLDEIRCLDGGGWYGDEFVGTRVPTLQDLLDWSAGGGSGVCLHIDARLSERDLHRVASAVLASGQAQRALVISGSFEQLAAVRQGCDQISTGILYAAGDDDFVERASIAGVDFLHPHRKTVTPELIAKAHDAELPVVACVDPTVELIRQRAAWGLDVFSCDKPDLVSAALEGRLADTR